MEIYCNPDYGNIEKFCRGAHCASEKELYAIYDQPAWNGKLRSKTLIRQTPKHHLVDPSLAVALLGASEDKLLRDFYTLGLLFESLCVRDVKIYSSVIDAEVFYYRDKSDLEVNIIIQKANGDWGAFEVKLGSHQEDEAAKNLLALAAKIDQNKTGKLKFLAILTGGKYAYLRQDGVYVIPIGCLGA
jgi:predicted AAA+ superfamily ATPase